MNLQPLGDRLIVEVLKEEQSTVSGIVLPDTAREKPQRGRVLAVGRAQLQVIGVLTPGFRGKVSIKRSPENAVPGSTLFSKWLRR